MIESLFNGLLTFFLKVISFVGSILFYPVQAILVTLMPSVGDFLSTITNFFNDSVFPTLCFLKNWIINFTCLPPALFSILVSTFFAFLTIAISLRVIVLIYRIYLIVRGAKV